MSEEKKIEIRSGEFQEILGSIPSWIVRYGILIFVVIFSLMVVFSFIFNYPDILRSDILVTTENPPITLVARATGKIDKLFVQDKNKVVAGQKVALVENPADYKHVQELKKKITQIQMAFDSSNFSNTVIFNKHLQLGEIQASYSTFLTKYEELKEFNQRSYYKDKEQLCQQQLKNARMLYDRLWEQTTVVSRELDIKKRNYQRQKKLLAGQIVSSTELEKAESEMLSKKSELDGLRSDLAQKQIDIGQLNQQVIENNKQFSDYRLKHESEVLETFAILNSDIRKWELTYLIQSPTEGTISFNAFFSENQNLSKDDRAFTIVPDNVGETVGKLQLPVRGAGKVKVGLDVNVKFENYPYMEFGLVRGKVKNISLVPEDRFYMVEVAFPNGLVTNYGKNLQMQNQLVGKAEIITEELSLIQRFFNPLNSLWKERVTRK